MSLQENYKNQFSLNPKVAKNLSNRTITIPMMESISPRWFLTFLPWVSVEAGIYRVNKIKKSLYSKDGPSDYRENLPELLSSHLSENFIPEAFPEYDENPKDYTLSIIQTILKINTQVTDIFNSPINQFNEQVRITMETMKEQQEWEIINNSRFGLVKSVSPCMKVQSRSGSPTPDDMDELLSKVWKKPAFFLAHPKAIAAFGRECTLRGVPPMTINIYGCPFITWRGVPIIPCDKLLIDNKSCPTSSGKTNILLMRVGEKERGVVGLHQLGIPDENIPSLSVRFAGIDNSGISSYILSLYFGTAILTEDSLGMLENVEVGKYHEYEKSKK